MQELAREGDSKREREREREGDVPSRLLVSRTLNDEPSADPERWHPLDHAAHEFVNNYLTQNRKGEMIDHFPTIGGRGIVSEICARDNSLETDDTTPQFKTVIAIAHASFDGRIIY